MKILAKIYDNFFNFYTFILLSVDKRDDELNLLVDCDEGDYFSVITLE